MFTVAYLINNILELSETIGHLNDDNNQWRSRPESGQQTLNRQRNTREIPQIIIRRRRTERHALVAKRENDEKQQ